MIKPLIIIIITLISAIFLCGSVSALDQSIKIEKSYTDLSGQPITTANPGDYIYGLITVHNSIPYYTAQLNVDGISNPSLIYTETYYTSHDYLETWTTNDGSFNPETGWQINDLAGGNVYGLRELFLVTGPFDLTADSPTDSNPTLSVDPVAVNTGSFTETTSLKTLKTSKKNTNLINTLKSTAQKMLAKLLKKYGIII